jgi:hypothetical protein
MRNRDGVSTVLGCLRHALWFDRDIITAGQLLTDNPYYARSEKPRQALAMVQGILNTKGYTGYEYLGFVSYYMYNCSRARVNEIFYIASENVVEEFLQFKKTRLHRLKVRMDLLRKYYKSQRHSRGTPFQVLQGLQGDCVRKLQIMLQYPEDFDPNDCMTYWEPRAFHVEHRLCVSPELLVVCPDLTRTLKEDGGANAAYRLTFPAD